MSIQRGNSVEAKQHLYEADKHVAERMLKMADSIAAQIVEGMYERLV